MNLNILGGLPVIGRGRDCEPTFKVQFEKGEESLDGIIKLATTRGTGVIVLAEAQLAEPVFGVEVYLRQSAKTLGYELEAKVVPRAGQRLKVSPHHFSDFEVRKQTQTYMLSSPQLPKNCPIQVRKNWPENKKGIDLYHRMFYGKGPTLVQEEVGNAITAFANALETAVNSVYHSAGKPSPKTTLELGVWSNIKVV